MGEDIGGAAPAVSVTAPAWAFAAALSAASAAAAEHAALLKSSLGLNDALAAPVLAGVAAAEASAALTAAAARAESRCVSQRRPPARFPISDLLLEKGVAEGHPPLGHLDEGTSLCGGATEHTSSTTSRAARGWSFRICLGGAA